jgi:hypothetical protein
MTRLITWQLNCSDGSRRWLSGEEIGSIGNPASWSWRYQISDYTIGFDTIGEAQLWLEDNHPFLPASNGHSLALTMAEVFLIKK